MSLKWKFAWVFLGLGALPVLIGAYFLLMQTEASFEQSFEERASGIERGVQERLKVVASDIDRSLKKIAADPIITRGLVEPLARGRFYEGDGDYERAIVRDARRLMGSAVLDTLQLIDLTRKGHVIALGHRMGFEAADTALAGLIEGHPEAAMLRHERIENDATGGTDSVWTLQVVHVIHEGPVKVALLGGRVVDARLLNDLRGVAGGIEVALDDVEGRRVAATFEGRDPPAVAGGYGVAERALTNPASPDAVARLRVYVSRAEVSARKDELWQSGGIVLGATLVIALALAFVSARRVSRPLEALARAAGEVAAGRRDSPVAERRGHDEVARLTRAFNQMTQDLADGEERLRQSERVAAWREIARRIAHEIKNPLSPIQISIETLRKAKEREHPQFDTLFGELTTTILEEVNRMKRIVSEFSDFARMPAPRLAEVDLVELVSQVVALFRETVPGVEVVVVAPDGVSLTIDPDQIRQAVINLVKNALEAIEADPGRRAKGGGRLEVRVERDGANVKVSVLDNGPGMSAETKQRVFTPYFTTKTTGKVTGTGLGLAIVHRIVEEHGGAISVDSTPGVGTRFVMRLPLVRVAAAG